MKGQELTDALKASLAEPGPCDFTDAHCSAFVREAWIAAGIPNWTVMSCDRAIARYALQQIEAAKVGKA